MADYHIKPTRSNGRRSGTDIALPTIAVAIRRFLGQGGASLITPQDLIQPRAKPKDETTS